jgi:DNA-directed RNA polymerase subunit L
MKTIVLKEEKNEVEVSLDNVTVAEILRVYLNNQGVEFAAWKREHPTKPVVIKVQSSGKTVKKEISDAVVAIKKDLNKISSSLKK